MCHAKSLKFLSKEMKEKGSISIHTENIFPIIKKFLYSDHEIFLRELVSNAVDATQKIKRLASLGEDQGELGNVTVDVKVDKEKKTIHKTALQTVEQKTRIMSSRQNTSHKSTHKNCHIKSMLSMRAVKSTCVSLSDRENKYRSPCMFS